MSSRDFGGGAAQRVGGEHADAGWHLMNTLSSALLGACWGVVAVVWLIGAVYNRRRAPQVGRRSGRAVLLAGAAVVLLIVNTLPSSAWSWGGAHSWALRAPGLALVLVSTGFALWARITLGTMWSSTAVVREDHRLRTSGPYAITRHPIYTGLLGMLLGTALANGLGGWLIAFVVGVALVELKIATEERLLTRAFPGAYERYRQQVPQLIPGLRLRARPRHAA